MTDQTTVVFTSRTSGAEFSVNKQANFSNNNKTILFIEPYGSTLSLVWHGIKNGMNIIIITANQDLRVVPEKLLQAATLSLIADTANESCLLQLVNQLKEYIKIDAVIPGFEYFVTIAAKLSHFLQIPGLHPADALALRNKAEMRRKLADHGLRMPQFERVRSLEEAWAVLPKFRFPVVCKPVDAAGSVNVKFAKNIREAMLAAQRIIKGNDVLWGHRLSNELLIEEYISGKEYSVEGVVYHGKCYFFSITEKFVHDQIEFIEIGHIVNAPLPDVDKIAIESYVSDILEILSVNACPFHAEIRMQDKQPILMEIAARLAGDKIADLISLARGINYFDYVYAAYLNTSMPSPQMQDHYAGIRFFFRPEIDSYLKVEGVDQIQMHNIEELRLYYEPHQPIPAFPKPLRRLGHVMMKSTQYDSILSTLKAVDEQLHFSTA